MTGSMSVTPRRIVAGLLAAAIWVGAAGQAAADRALIVVNADYRDLRDLAPGPVVQRLSDALSRAGFEVTAIEDATTGGLLSALRRLSAEPDPDGAAVFWFVGYARQHRDRTFLVARNARPSGPFDFMTQGIDLGSVLRSLETAGGRVQLAVLDAAYPEPRLDALEGMEPGLAEPTPGPTAAVAFGARPGVILRDGEGAVALAESFARALSRPGDPLGEILARFSATASEVAGREVALTIGSRANVALASPAASAPAAPAAPEPEPAAPAPAAEPSPGARIPAPQTGPPATAERAAPEREIPPAEFEAGLDLADRRRVQEALSALGLYRAAIDGDFGPLTRRAIATFQRLRGFDATGVLGPDQMALLFDLAQQ